jgi:2-dehydro-3-deoxygluconokinase
MSFDGRVVCFGETLVRLSAPVGEMLLQSPHLKTCFGGAETNVAVSLSRLGDPAALVTVLPENALGRAAFDELRRHGVAVDQVQWGPGRMGLYFLTPGAVNRPSDVVYDRAGSAFAEAPADRIDWRAALAGAGLLHLSGVTPALGPMAAEAAVRAAEAAVALGVPVSFDGNFRGKLWAAWNGDPPTLLKRLLACASLAFIDERDTSLILGATIADGDAAARRRHGAAEAFAAFPRLQRIASTFRRSHRVDHHDLSAALFTRAGEELHSRAAPLIGIIDRIGGGDAFAAGLLHGLRSGRDDQAALDFALAAACLKHAVFGDFNPAGEAEVLAVIGQEGTDVKR